MLRFVTHAFQIVEVFGGYLLQKLAHSSHADRRQTVAHAVPIELSAEILHEFPALRRAGGRSSLLEVGADVLHESIVSRR